MRILIVWLINTVALLALPYLMTSIRISGFWTALIAALVLGLVNALIRPVLGFADIAGDSCNIRDFHPGDQWLVVLVGFQNGGWFLCHGFLGCGWRGIVIQYYLVGLVHFATQELNAITEKFQY